MQPLPLLVCGFDPGLRAPGFALIEVRGQSRSLLESRTVKPDPHAPMGERLYAVGCALVDFVQRADLICIEDQHGVFFGALERGESNANAAHNMKVMGMAIGAALALGRPWHLIAPQRLRTMMGVAATATKQMVARAVRVQCAGAEGKPLPETDATAIAVAGHREWHVVNRTIPARALAPAAANLATKEVGPESRLPRDPGPLSAQLNAPTKRQRERKTGT